MGGWRQEMAGGAADLIGPKEYALHNAMVGTEYVVKGVPAEVAKQYFETGVARFFRALPIREAIAQGKNPSEWVETFKTHRSVVPKRYPGPPNLSASGSWRQTYPYEVQQLPEAVAGSHLQPEGEPPPAGRPIPVQGKAHQRRLLPGP